MARRRKWKKQTVIAYCSIRNVPIPLPLNDTYRVAHFENAMNYYPQFIQRSGLDWSFARYMSVIMQELNKARPREIYDGSTAFVEWVTIYGKAHYRALRQQFK